MKDDERGDPLIVDEAVAALGIMSLEQVREAKAVAVRAARIIRDHLQEKGLELLDIKFELGAAERPARPHRRRVHGQHAGCPQRHGRGRRPLTSILFPNQ